MRNFGVNTIIRQNQSIAKKLNLENDHGSRLIDNFNLRFLNHFQLTALA